MLDAGPGEVLPPAPIRTLIVDAKTAQNNIAENKGNFSPGDDNALNALKERLEGAALLKDEKFKAHETTSEGEQKKQENLDDLRWNVISEQPSDSPEAPQTFQKQEKPQQEKVDLDKAARADLDDYKTPYLRSLLQAAHSVVRGRSSTPEEIDAFVVLAHHDQAGRNSSGNERLITNAFAILRGQGKTIDYGNVSFYGIDAPYPRQDAADMIINDSKQVSKNLTQDDLDRVVEASLGCGNVYAAVDLMQKASQLITKSDGTEANSAFSRLGRDPTGSKTLLDKTREIYANRPKDSYKDKLLVRLDGVLASIGEGQFESLKDSPNAMAVKKEAEQRLTERLKVEQNEWYHSQQVSNTELRKQQLDETHLEVLVEEAANNGNGWDAIDRQISQRSEKAADAEMANFIAAELQRRLNPELSLQAQMEKTKRDARGDYSTGIFNRSSYGAFNLYENEVYGYGTSSNNKDLSPGEKAIAVDKAGRGIYETELEKTLFQNGTDIKDLIRLLTDSRNYEGNMTLINQKIRRGEFNGLDVKTEADRKRSMAQKLVAGTEFLQAIIANPEGRRILEQEFGFKYIANPDSIERAQESLQKMFPEVVDKDSGLTIYEEALGKAQGEASEQAEEDTLMIGKISRARNNDAQEMTTGGIKAAREAAQKIHDRLNQEHKGLILKQEGLKEPLARQQKIKADLEALSRRRTSVNRTTEVKNKLQKLIQQGALTTEDKQSIYTQIEQQEQVLNQQLEEVTKQISALGGTVDQVEIDGLAKRMSSIRKLMELK